MGATFGAKWKMQDVFYAGGGFNYCNYWSLICLIFDLISETLFSSICLVDSFSNSGQENCTKALIQAAYLAH